MTYKHTQIGYLMITVTLIVLALFIWMYITAAAEPQSYNSGPNFAITSMMILIVFTLASFSSLNVSIHQKQLKIKFSRGLYQKKFPLTDIVSAKAVKNHRWYGWGIRICLWPKMWIYNVSGFDAVEIQLKNGKIYRIGTDEPKILEQILLE